MAVGSGDLPLSEEVPIVQSILDPERLRVAEALQERLQPALGGEVVEGLAAALPVAEVIENDGASRRDAIVERPQRQEHAVVPVAVEVEEGDRLGSGVLLEGLLEPPLLN